MHINTIKTCAITLALGASGLLVACQSLPPTAKKEASCLPSEVKQHGCVAVAGKPSSKTAKVKQKRYTAKFKIDPHARHKLTTRIAIEDSSTEEKIDNEDGVDNRSKNDKKKDEINKSVEKKRKKMTEKVATFSVNNPDYKFRHYAQSIVSPYEHAPRVVRYQEKEGYSRVRSGDLQFDALFALANNEMRTHFISRTSDTLYQNAQSFACDCYGDPLSPHFLSSSYLALAGHLSLAMMTPERMKNSLLFQLSPYRDDLVKPVSVLGDKQGLQILQRAEKFGAWPVYSSRILWSLAAQSVWVNLPDDQRNTFSKTAYHAMKNTIEIDRYSIFDGSDGLYFGGHDLNEWPSDMQGVDLATIKSLVVNAVYFRALVFASDLAAMEGDVAISVKYLDWALDLKNAINQHFWDATLGVYRSFLFHHIPSSSKTPIARPRWWGYALWEQSLLLEFEIAEAFQRVRISEYTLGESSPFGEAFSLRAAAKHKNIAIANRAYKNLFSRASQKLTHASGGEKGADAGVTGDGLVSVSAYFSSVVEGVFGIRTTAKGISFNPFITAKLRREQFALQRSIALYDVTFRGKKFDIKINLPRVSSSAGFYDVANIKVNGKQHAVNPVQDNGRSGGSKRLNNSTKNEIEWSTLPKENTVIITLGKLKSGKQGLLEFPRSPERSQAVWTEEKVSAPRSGAMTVPVVKGRKFIASWGGEDENLTLTDINITLAGRYAIQWEYRMGGKAAVQERGLHNGVKRLRLTDANNNELVSKVVQFPIVTTSKSSNKKRKSASWSLSSPVIVTLAPGTYRVDLDDFMNMSYLKANMTYTGIGGRSGATNRFDVKGLRITPL
ncbi:MAG: hypothetical protein K6L80_10840 [Agarilytica sp.]